MKPANGDSRFAGSIPQLYERFLVPLIFEPYAADLAARIARRRPARVLEVAAGTGVATRALARELARDARLVATDLNGPMLEEAKAKGTCRDVEWRQADAAALPFDDGAFDAVACQFGAMFFADKRAAFAEIRRVLAPGGNFVFSAWDRIEENHFAQVVSAALEPLFPADPPRFLQRTPHGYFDARLIGSHLADAGFRSPPRFETIAARSRASSCREPAIAYCQGTPLRNDIEARGTASLGEATDAAAAGIAARFGQGPVDGKIQARVVAVAR